MSKKNRPNRNITMGNEPITQTENELEITEETTDENDGFVDIIGDVNVDEENIKTEDVNETDTLDNKTDEEILNALHGINIPKVEEAPPTANKEDITPIVPERPVIAPSIPKATVDTPPVLYKQEIKTVNKEDIEVVNPITTMLSHFKKPMTDSLLPDVVKEMKLSLLRSTWKIKPDIKLNFRGQEIPEFAYNNTYKIMSLDYNYLSIKATEGNYANIVTYDSLESV